MADQRILDLFDRDVSRRIEEVIKVDQTRSDVVRREIEEYVVTDPIKASFTEILDRFQETPNNPHEGIGIWVSGFFGAGKSSFAKILGYVLEDRELDGTSAAELFAERTADPTLQALIRKINDQIPARSVIFDVSTDQSVVDNQQKLTDVVYRVLLRELGYATDREIAELEITLEGEGRLSEFRETFERLYPERSWDEVKQLSVTARSMASAVLHEMDPETYPDADSWAHTPHEVDVSPNRVAERAFELIQRRGDGRGLVFVVDEVGQYVARSTEKMLDLQGLVQALGRVGHNRHRDWKGQVWLVVTSQERLSEVVDNLAGRQVELARLRDRFPIEVDLAPSDIREVTSERVLKKTVAARDALADLFQEHRGKVREATHISGGAYSREVTEEDFVELYPFLPYQIDLVINIVSGLRTQGGASRHVGGANRTIIKLAQQVLIHERTRLGDEAVGRLVTLDMIYDLLEGLVNTERRQDLAEITEAFGEGSAPVRVAKALAMLQFVNQLPRTAENLAAVLHPSVDAAPERATVDDALEALEEAKRVRRGEDGWELLSKAGKDWQEEKRSLEGSPRRRRELLEGFVEQALEDASGYRHQGLKTFRPAPVIHGRRIGRSGDVEIRIQLALDPGAADDLRDRARRESNTEEGKNALHWVLPVPDELHRFLRDLERSEEMVRRYEQETLSPDQARLLSDEKTAVQRLRSRAAGKVRKAIAAGDSYFRGVHSALEEYGDSVRDVVRGALEASIPKLYPNFEMIGVRVRSQDAGKILESESMSGLPPVYYEGSDGLGLVRREGGEYQVHADHPALREVLDFIEERAQYESEAQGKAIENRFTGYGYGWDMEAVMLLTATLLRAAKIEVYHGRRYTSYAETGVREVFRRTPVFRSASFKPRGGGLDLPTLADCADALQEIVGEQVNVEEGAIADTLRSRFPDYVARCHRVLGHLEANGLPGAEALRELIHELEGIQEGSAEDTVLAFHGQLASVREGLDRLAELEKAVEGDNLALLRRARRAVDDMLPQLRDVGTGEEVGGAGEKLTGRLESSDFCGHLPDIGRLTREIEGAYENSRASLMLEIKEALERSVDRVRNQPEWEALDDEGQKRVLAPFAPLERKLERDGVGLTELESDLKAVPALTNDAMAQLAVLAGGDGEEPPPVRRIRVSNFVGGGLSTEEEVEEMVEGLRQACLEAVARGEKVVLE